MIKQAGAFLISALMFSSTAWANVPKHIDGMSKTTRAHAEQALACSKRLGRDPGLLIVADMRLPSSAARLWAIDTRTSEVILRTEVAHGRGSDPSNAGKAQVFSNTPGSLMTSVGLYAVSEQYVNTTDNSKRRRLDGLMVGFNDAARERAVVLHPSKYVRDGWAGRSEGCPAVSYADMDQLNAFGLDNAILWIEGDQEGLAEAIADCSGSKIRERFRWPWQPRPPKKPKWSPDASDPTLDLDAGMCLNLVEGRRVWWTDRVYAQVADHPFKLM
ncbi:murein L,D-transpeptidase catalytic domain-containing protein [Luteimonas sp. MC1750]|uniref:murein L,D-transpeptidase catalytic domain-containing protein n=1 Tax=Luteimonas sp. MC1750 TaxID=2799326 RepID=UPI0018F06F23|nr:murein L,D-transpeptidase catalytic domain family protein [Luteimonas sp. MC1750]MBJ6984038.1 murein L,D-transpeptidase catalytic domain family protein [Luteimonas sp. MC1750]QQO06850.1 murein L,D-transpeptidase catalytic domain family protein [Luteimonas sp. MC1750]